MIYGIGIDITEIDRVARLMTVQPDFIDKLLTSNEIDQLAGLTGQRRYEFVAGRWSAKESYSKAFGTGIGKEVGFQDIEVLDNDRGKPDLTKHPFDGNAFISISHSSDAVVTQVILESGDVS